MEKLLFSSSANTDVTNKANAVKFPGESRPAMAFINADDWTGVTVTGYSQATKNEEESEMEDGEFSADARAYFEFLPRHSEIYFLTDGVTETTNLEIIVVS